MPCIESFQAMKPVVVRPFNVSKIAWIVCSHFKILVGHLFLRVFPSPTGHRLRNIALWSELAKKVV